MAFCRNVLCALLLPNLARGIVGGRSIRAPEAVPRGAVNATSQNTTKIEPKAVKVDVQGEIKKVMLNSTRVGGNPKEQVVTAATASGNATAPKQQKVGALKDAGPNWQMDLVKDGGDEPKNSRAGKTISLGEGGFSLKVLNGSEGCEKPKDGDRLTLDYTGFLAGRSGTVFDSSRSRGVPFEFVVGQGKVIPGWDQGLLEICLGERGILHVPAYKAYGSEGAPPAIPPSADLDFDIELLAINDVGSMKYEEQKRVAEAAKIHAAEQKVKSGAAAAATAAPMLLAAAVCTFLP